ncbi:LuxR family transcriptional regulator [Gordoniibacillus kamchatkensis]|uniref:LuxR family transcriptional regulator n=1 Tax=Gordoniibacillus kamchatkensis TaxID=1590651 RepID=A0ABR5ALI0_9BACL|nr:response regulator transcription factor [Paenibacillus sp. VKM B-2647]KIL41881.1 LuxR family transcriptional regulator [Paenibacillus sp. VKM B-2647]
MSGQVKVMIVDDHDMVRAGLKTYMALEPELAVVAEAGNGKEALRLLADMAPEARPDVMLVDLMMPVMDGIETTREVTGLYPDIRVVMLTSFLEEAKVVQAVEAGAMNYVLKTVSSDQLVATVLSAARGVPVMNSEVSLALTRGLRQRNAPDEADDLTAREKEVLLLIAEGKTNKEISETLHISIKTVKTHVSNLLMKCELEDRTQLAIFAHRKGWIGKQGS